MIPFDILSNSPLRAVPEDYCPSGSDHWFTIPTGHDAGKTMFYMDYVLNGDEAEHTILFIHGNPECSYTYRNIRQELEKQTDRPLRIVAMDHIGFGISDQAHFEMIDMHHAANLRYLVRALDLKNVTLVIHDWGGAIGTGALIDEPERVNAICVVNTTIFPISKTEGITYNNFPTRLMPWPKWPSVVPDFLWGAVASYVLDIKQGGTSQLVAGILKHFGRQITGALDKEPMGPEKVWRIPLSTKMNVRSSKRNARQTPNWGHGYSYHDKVMGIQDNREFYRHLQDRFPKVWGPEGRNLPAAGIFGQWDVLAKDSVINQWKAALPRISENLTIFADEGHFVEEHKPTEIAEAILKIT